MTEEATDLPDLDELLLVAKGSDWQGKKARGGPVSRLTGAPGAPWRCLECSTPGAFLGEVKGLPVMRLPERLVYSEDYDCTVYSLLQFC